jgi:high affinity Mn2+ porin
LPRTPSPRAMVACLTESVMSIAGPQQWRVLDPTRWRPGWLLSCLVIAACWLSISNADENHDSEATLPPPRALLGMPIAGGCPTCAPEKPAASYKNAAKAKTPAPSTACQALHAYCHCLHLRWLGIEPTTEKDAKGDKEKKAVPENGNNNGKADRKEKDAATEKSNGEAKEPSSTPGTRGKTGETEKEGKENGKEEKKDADENGGSKEEKEAGPAWYSAHAQATVVTQIHQHWFRSPYVGPNSLLPSEPAATSMTGTLFLDMRLWEDCGSSGELIFNPETSGGRGFSDVMGIAGFPNGEISRVGVPEPTPYIARLFLRQTWGLGGEQEKIADAINLIAGMRDVNRITVVIGKIPPTDLVDDNRYSHDPRTQFLNWSLMYNGAYDYPANVRGYDYGYGIEFNHKDWAFRYGGFGEPEVANGAAIDPKLFVALGQVMEYEQRWMWEEHPGHARFLAYLNHAHMGNYREALFLMPVDPNITETRAYRIKYGFGLSWDQEVSKDLGIFGRLGWNNGQSESWAFTEIDETASLGMVLKGRCWCRPNDVFGLGVACNGLSSPHRDYLAAGGLGFIIGDGRLNYGLEKILETYYAWQISKGIIFTLDFQEVDHPAYNKDRGPVAIGSMRVHIEF